MAVANLYDGSNSGSSSPYMTQQTLSQIIAALAKSQNPGTSPGTTASNPTLSLLQPQYYNAPANASMLTNPPLPPVRPAAPVNAAGSGLHAFNNQTASGAPQVAPAAAPPQQAAPQAPSVNQLMGQNPTYGQGGTARSPLSIFLSQLTGQNGQAQGNSGQPGQAAAQPGAPAAATATPTSTASPLMAFLQKLGIGGGGQQPQSQDSGALNTSGMFDNLDDSMLGGSGSSPFAGDN